MANPLLNNGVQFGPHDQIIWVLKQNVCLPQVFKVTVHKATDATVNLQPRFEHP